MTDNFDFAKVRELYIQTSFFQPLGAFAGMNFSSFSDRQAKGDKTVNDDVNKFVDDNFAMAGAQSRARDFYTKSGDSDEAAYHEWVLRGLMNVLLKSGDGLTAKTAYHPVDKIEEYMIVSSPDSRVAMHSTRFADGHPYDVLTMQYKSGEKKDFWFENSAFFGKGLPGVGKK